VIPGNCLSFIFPVGSKQPLCLWQEGGSRGRDGAATGRIRWNIWNKWRVWAELEECRYQWWCVHEPRTVSVIVSAAASLLSPEKASAMSEVIWVKGRWKFLPPYRKFCQLYEFFPYWPSFFNICINCCLFLFCRVWPDVILMGRWNVETTLNSFWSSPGFCFSVTFPGI